MLAQQSGMVAHNCSPITQEAEARNPQVGGQAGLQSVPVSKNSYLSFSYLSQTAWSPATRLSHVPGWFEILRAHENYLRGLILKQPFLYYVSHPSWSLGPGHQYFCVLSDFSFPITVLPVLRERKRLHSNRGAMCRQLLGEGESSCLKADQAHSSGSQTAKHAYMGSKTVFTRLKKTKEDTSQISKEVGGSYGRNGRRGCDQNTMNKNSQGSWKN